MTKQHSTAAFMAVGFRRAARLAHVPTGFRVPWGQGPMALMLAEFEE